MLSLSLGLFLACSDQGFVPAGDDAEPFTITIDGQACDPLTGGWLVGATVYTNVADENGTATATISTTTDAEGKWLLEGLEQDAAYRVYFQVGSEVVDMIEVRVQDDDVSVGQSSCDVSDRVAVVTGDYDDFSETFGALGIAPPTDIDGTSGNELVQFLSNSVTLSSFKAIFFAGGHIEEDVLYDQDGDSGPQVTLITQNLKAFVDAGGSLFVSDWSYDLVERIWPDAFDFVGDDHTPDAAQLGEPANVDAQVTDGNLEDVVGSSTLTVDFDADTWPVIDSAGDGVVVHLQGDVPWRLGLDTGVQHDSPIAASFVSGSGMVVVTSFRLVSNLEGEPLEASRYLVSLAGVRSE